MGIRIYYTRLLISLYIIKEETFYTRMYIKFESIILSRRAEKPYKILLCSKKKRKNIQKYFTRCFVKQKKKKSEDLDLDSGIESKFKFT